MPRLPRKKIRVLTTIETKARLEAEAKFLMSPKGITSSIIRMIERIDPLELVATVSGAFIIYDIIKSIPEIQIQSENIMVSSVLHSVLDPLWLGFIADKILEGLEISPEEKQKLIEMRDTPDFILFIKCIAISYIMIKHSGQIISGVGNITGFVASFVGLKMVV